MKRILKLVIEYQPPLDDEDYVSMKRADLLSMVKRAYQEGHRDGSDQPHKRTDSDWQLSKTKKHLGTYLD